MWSTQDFRQISTQKHTHTHNQHAYTHIHVHMHIRPTQWMCQIEKPMYSINLCYCSLRNTLESKRRRKPLTKCIRLTMGGWKSHAFFFVQNADLSKCLLNSSTPPHAFPFCIFLFVFCCCCCHRCCSCWLLLLLFLHFHRALHIHTHTINCYRSPIIQLLFKWSEHFHFYYSF